MKIIIANKMPKPIQRQLNADEYKNLIIDTIEAKLGRPAGSPFARWEQNVLIFNHSAKIRLHNKLIILCAIFVDYECRWCHTEFGSFVRLQMFDSVEILEKLYNFINHLDLENTSISFEL